MGGVKMVEYHLKIGKICLMFLVYTFYQCFRANALLLGTKHNRRAMGIIRTDVIACMALHSLESHPDVRLDILHQVAYMD